MPVQHALIRADVGTHHVGMPGLVPGIHVLFSWCVEDVDGRDKSGHDESLAQAVGYQPCVRFNLGRHWMSDSR